MGILRESFKAMNHRFKFHGIYGNFYICLYTFSPLLIKQLTAAHSGTTSYSPSFLKSKLCVFFKLKNRIQHILIKQNPY